MANKTGTVESNYIDDDKKKASYTFATQNEKPKDAKEDPETGKPISSGSSISPKNSIDYNATTGTLSIGGDTIVGTPDPSDPLLGTSVNFSDYQFTGLTSDGTLAIFWPTSANGLMTITNGANAFERGDLSVLFYMSPTTCSTDRRSTIPWQGCRPIRLFTIQTWRLSLLLILTV